MVVLRVDTGRLAQNTLLQEVVGDPARGDGAVVPGEQSPDAGCIQVGVEHRDPLPGRGQMQRSSRERRRPAGSTLERIEQRDRRRAPRAELPGRLGRRVEPAGLGQMPVQHPEPVGRFVSPRRTPRLLLPRPVRMLPAATSKHGPRPIIRRHLAQLIIDLPSTRFPTPDRAPENHTEPGQHILDDQGAPFLGFGGQPPGHPCFGLLMSIIEVLHQIVPAR